MAKPEVTIGLAPLAIEQQEVTLQNVTINNEVFNRISNVDVMSPFLMSITSCSNHWMFVSSLGPLTSGRGNPSNALFPYYTDDKIHDSYGITGPLTLIRVKDGEGFRLWTPFSNLYHGLYRVSRNLYKNIQGNKLIFEEVNHNLLLGFRYTWMNSELFGWVRKCQLSNLGNQQVALELIDGLQNVLPWGVDRNMQTGMSTLVDAYKKTERVEGHNLVIFRLSSIPVDRAEPSEALRANTIWHHGLPNPIHLLSTNQLKAFSQGADVVPEEVSKGVRGAMLTKSSLALAPNQHQEWYSVLEVSQDSIAIQKLLQQLQNPERLIQMLESDVDAGTESLSKLVALADGVQTTGDAINDQRHFANVMFNIMRGGLFVKGYSISIKQFLKHLKKTSLKLWNEFGPHFDTLEDNVSLGELIAAAKRTNNPHVVRVAHEFLPLSFSRRHGDPSRPWNQFDIQLKDPSGDPSISYQGNWRDIFQNWEALALSFPAFLPGMITRFLNASTADGYNPYRLTSNGFDWEVLDPADPWSNIGYWGDHQIIYLLKLMELQERYFPNSLSGWLAERIFAYANVPYRVKPYEDILADPYSTIDFLHEEHNRLKAAFGIEGADAKLLRGGDGNPILVSLAEKLLVSLLVKLSNFVPGAGVWLNAQRPEWNDANNALVGHGTSMVTVYYLRRYIHFVRKLLSGNAPATVELSKEVANLVVTITRVLESNAGILQGAITDSDRRLMMDALGRAGSEHRESVYNGLGGGMQLVETTRIVTLLEASLNFIDHTIESNRRPDGLYHAYNLIDISPSGVKVLHLPLMLEGQVALLCSGVCSFEQSLGIVKSLFESDLWRSNQQSFMLYPNVELPHFLDKNIVPREAVAQSELLQQLLNNGDTSIITADTSGRVYFNADFRNVGVLRMALAQLPSPYTELAREETQRVCDTYEVVFNHKYFTGRSGSFYKYEGLGSIYWHMVSKLLLGVGDILIANPQASPAQREELTRYYWAIRRGIGAHKSPLDYGAFPTDPYSHTPAMMGVQQPGMTGQVKEDILSRYNELGIVIDNGSITVNPTLLSPEDFKGVDNRNELAFTLASTPFTYIVSTNNYIELVLEGERKERYEGLMIPASVSSSIFLRTGEVKRVLVNLTI